MAHRVAVLVLDGASLFEVSIAFEVFGVHRAEIGHLYGFEPCAPGGRATIEGGLQLPTVGDLDTVEGADTVLVPYADVAEPAEPRIAEVLRTARSRGARVVSFRSGAFLLAQAGLLDAGGVGVNGLTPAAWSQGGQPAYNDTHVVILPAHRQP